MYYTCTWDYSQYTGNSPWCSVETDDNNQQLQGTIVIDGKEKKFYGICDDRDACIIPPRRKLCLKLIFIKARLQYFI